MLKLFVFLMMMTALPLLASETPTPTPTPPPPPQHETAATPTGKPPAPLPSGDYACIEHESVTQGEVQIEGQRVEYTARAGTFVLRNSEGVEKATLFYVAYTKNQEDGSKRPITFCTNGGPGSSSVWLHMGLLGPKRIVLGDTQFIAPPYQLIDNSECLLDQTDLVFIDPVSTGFSRAANGEAATQFHGVKEDVQWIAQFIRLYLTRNERWLAPKFFFGESYGTTRAVALLYYLHRNDYIDFNGACLISMLLDFQTQRFDAANDLPYLLTLPTYTATAWYHQKLPKDLQENFTKARQESESFALNGYAQALLKGAMLTPTEEEALAQKLARLTGLSTQYIKEAHFRIDILHFAKELLRQQEKVVGRFDSRVSGIDPNQIADTLDYDTSMDVFFGPFTAGFNHYVRNALKWRSDLPYNIMANVRPWNFDDATNRYFSASQDLQDLLTRNPKMQVFVASGYYDLATPYFAAEYTLKQLSLPLPPAMRSHITNAYYNSGHLVYVHPQSLQKLRQDLVAFYKRTLQP